MKLVFGLAFLSLFLMAAKCEQGSSVNSDAQAYCKTHYASADACATDDRCAWNTAKGVCKEK